AAAGLAAGGLTAPASGGCGTGAAGVALTPTGTLGLSLSWISITCNRGPVWPRPTRSPCFNSVFSLMILPFTYVPLLDRRSPTYKPSDAGSSTACSQHTVCDP